MRDMDPAINPVHASYVDDHMLALLAAAAETTGRDYGRAFGGWLKLARHTGLELGELVALETHDVDVGRACLVITRTWPRRNRGPVELDERRRRMVPLSGPARRALAELDWHPGSTIVVAAAGGPLSPNGFHRRFQRVTISAGLGRLRYADLRLSYLQDLTAAGDSAECVGAQLGINAQTVREHWRRLGLRRLPRSHKVADPAPAVVRGSKRFSDPVHLNPHSRAS